MGVPNIKFKYSNGNLGGSNPLDDGIAGLIIQAPVTPKTSDGREGLAFGVSKAIFSLDDAATLGITKDYDTTNKCSVYGEISDFYGKVGGKGELWLMLVPNTVTMETICDLGESYATKLLTDSNGRICIWGVACNPSSEYAPTITEGIDSDVFAAADKAQALIEELALNRYMPSRAILPGRAFDNTKTEDLRNLKGSTNNGVLISLHGRKGSKEARVGFLLGLIASLPVQRNIGRVANGDLGIDEAYLTDGVTRAESIAATQDMLHDKGYVFPIVRPGFNGYFYNDDPMATSNADDFSSLANARVIDKVQRIAYNVYAQRINDDFALSVDGKIGPVELKALQGDIEDAINALMVSAGELSSFACYVDGNQDVIATGKTIVKLRAQPRGYHKTIEVEMGFVKSQNE